MRNGRKRRERNSGPVICLAAVLSLFIASASSAAEAESNPGKIAKSLPAATETAPETATDLLPVFRQPAPVSVDDLRLIEEKVVELTERVRECTVSLQIGRAQGSGVIVSPDGYILTAGHVSGKPGKFATIILPNGDRIPGRTLGINDTLDAGLVKITTSRTDWPHAPMGDTGQVEVGDWCLVMGHPGGYDETRGVVARLGRIVFGSNRIMQTDCELVGGDSGGPVFDMNGQVIGINSRIQRNLNHNFHTPIKAFHDGWDRLKEGEQFKVHSGALLGISGEDEDGGVRLTRIYPDEPAERAGLKVGDLLITFQSRRVRSLEQLIERVGEELPGGRVTVGVIRDGESLEFRVRLGVRWD
ncbi:trypsin-like peptidase domain-containing protein [Maioricimonas sp. JC845]|uniref:S1C family serine protease n=1 Tax=Maioricimonas sp. JC845 TaxID=3232138 RepID=UPI0034581618